MDTNNRTFPLNFSNFSSHPILQPQPLPTPSLSPTYFIPPLPIFPPILSDNVPNLPSSTVAPPEDMFQYSPQQVSTSQLAEVTCLPTTESDTFLEPPTSSSPFLLQMLNPGPSRSTPTPYQFHYISWLSPDNFLVKQMASITEGIMLLTDLGISVPMREVRETFCHMFQNTATCTQLNKLRPPRGIYKYKSFMDKSIDQKVMMDFHMEDLIAIFERGIEMGSAFNRVLDFYNDIQCRILPRLMEIHFEVIAGEVPGTHTNWNESCSPAGRIRDLHLGRKNILRLLDYPPLHKKGQRCAEHRDISTFTLIFQDQIQDGLEVLLNGTWISVPREAEVVLLWGWASFILSNGRLHAPLHRVMPTLGSRDKKAPRRNEVVLFVTPDDDAQLFPSLRFPEEKLSFSRNSVQDLTFGIFKEIFGVKWHRREGTTNDREEELLRLIKSVNNGVRSQETEILEFLTGNWSAPNDVILKLVGTQSTENSEASGSIMQNNSAGSSS